MLNRPAFIDYLRQHRLIDGDDVTVSLLTGGVSGEVAIVRTCEREFVVKKALDKLKVKEEWLCDAGRNLNEYRAIQFVGTFLPQAVPRLLYVDPDRNLFAMEYFDSGFVTWKEQLLSGNIHIAAACRAAELLATIHNTTWHAPEVQRQFDTTDNFIALRIEPYLITTGRRHSKLQAVFESEAARLASARIALVHGDFSAKNILVSADRQVILDWEVAWFGDPAFDSAFLLNLLLLKSLYRREQCLDFLHLVDAFRQTYASSFAHFNAELDQRIARLTLLLLLARIDGKSPAEYITDESQRSLVREFVTATLLDGEPTFERITAKWRREVLGQC